MEATAWRFNRYAERAREATGADHPPPDSFRRTRTERAAERPLSARQRARPGRSDERARIASLAWPLFFGQLAVLAFSTVDTVMTARSSAADLAALAVGGAVYITVFVGFMGVVLASARSRASCSARASCEEAGRELHQAMWLASGCRCSAASCCCSRSRSSRCRMPRRGARQGARLPRALAFALPSALLFTAFRGFNTAVSRPKVVMALQFGALALKVPLNALLVFGLDCGPAALPALGATGCGIATAIVMAASWRAWLVLRRDPFYRRSACSGGLAPPRARAWPAAAARRADGPGDRHRGDRLHLHGVLHRAARRDAGGRPPDRGQPRVDPVHDAAGLGQRDQRRWSRSASAPTTARRAAHRLARACSWRAHRRRDGRAVYLTPRGANAGVHARRAHRRRRDAAARVGDPVPQSPTRRRRWPPFTLRAYKIATLPVVTTPPRSGASGFWPAATSSRSNVTGWTPPALLGAARLLVGGDGGADGVRAGIEQPAAVGAERQRVTPRR
jgi:hypothetical protein